MKQSQTIRSLLGRIETLEKRLQPQGYILKCVYGNDNDCWKKYHFSEYPYKPVMIETSKKYDELTGEN